MFDDLLFLLGLAVRHIVLVPGLHPLQRLGPKGRYIRYNKVDIYISINKIKYIDRFLASTHFRGLDLKVDI